MSYFQRAKSTPKQRYSTGDEGSLAKWKSVKKYYLLAVRGSYQNFPELKGIVYGSNAHIGYTLRDFEAS